MVFFTCNACGQSIKKNKVDKHWQTECPNCTVLSCMDCGRDFYGDEYMSHTSCVTEAEKYQGPLFKGEKGGQTKGEKKQQEWLQKISEAVTSGTYPSHIGKLIEIILEYPNIPRKKAKFENFVKNSVNVRDKTTMSQLWEIFNQDTALSSTEDIVKTITDTCHNDDKMENHSKEVQVSSTKNDTNGGDPDEIKEKKKKHKRNKVDKVTQIHVIDYEPDKAKEKMKQHKRKLYDQDTQLDVTNNDPSEVKVKKEHKRKLYDQDTQLDVTNNDPSEVKEKKQRKRKLYDQDIQLDIVDDDLDGIKKKSKYKKVQDQNDHNEAILVPIAQASTNGDFDETKRKRKKNKKMIHDDGVALLPSATEKPNLSIDTEMETPKPHRKKYKYS